MKNKNVIQKLVPFETNGKNIDEFNKNLKEGWYVTSITKHGKDIFLCTLEKNLDSSVNQNNGNITVQEILNLANIRKSKYSNTQVSSEKEIIKEKERILEDA